MRRHFIILMILTVLVRGWMMISYPMSGTDDNQAAQTYLVNQLLNGNLLIGNLRYQTGYPFLIAPVFALARPFGQFDDRIILLVQVALSATIPFMVYDIVRRRRSPREAFIVALFVLLDPFGLQWAHFYLPEWLIACAMVFSIWLLERNQYSSRSTSGAGIVLGFVGLMRLNMIPIVALFCILILAYRSFSRRKRFTVFVTLAGISGGIALLYLVLIQYPSVGTWQINCISGMNLVQSVKQKGLTVQSSNGPNSARYVELTALKTPKQIMFLSDTFGKWQQPNSWATPDELQAFLHGSTANGYPVSEFELAYFLGPCPSDTLMRSAFFETLATDPLRWVGASLQQTVNVLTQTPIDDSVISRTMGMPSYRSLTFQPGGLLGFQKAGGSYYTGEWVWTPGIWLFTTLFPILNLSKWLILPALIWVLFSCDRFYITGAILMTAAALSISMVDEPEPRIYSAMYPFVSILIGGMVAALLRRWRRA